MLGSGSDEVDEVERESEPRGFRMPTRTGPRGPRACCRSPTAISCDQASTNPRLPRGFPGSPVPCDRPATEKESYPQRGTRGSIAAGRSAHQDEEGTRAARGILTAVRPARPDQHCPQENAVGSATPRPSPRDSVSARHIRIQPLSPPKETLISPTPIVKAYTSNARRRGTCTIS